jgi:hypothetical protein
VKISMLARYVLAYSAAAALGVTGGWLAAVVSGSSEDPAMGQGAGVTITRTSIAPLDSSFTMRGKLSGLAPGDHRILNVRVTNPNDWRIKLKTVGVVASNAAPGCSAKFNLHVGSYDASRANALTYIVPRRGIVVVPIRIKLRDAARRNQDLCKHVAFPLRYFGTARALHPSLSAGPP